MLWSTVHNYFPFILFLLTSSTTTSIDDCDPAIERAISHGDLETVQRALERDTNNSLIEKRGREIACIAAEKGNLSIIELIAARKSSILEKDYACTILHPAVAYGHLNIVEYWMKWCHVSWGGNAKSLFDKAAEKGHLNVIQFFRNMFSNEFDGLMDPLWRDVYSGSLKEYVDSITKLAADNGHLDIICYIGTIQQIDCSEFKDIMRSAIQKGQKRDTQTLELVLKLATEWEQQGYCPNIVQLAYLANDTKVVQYLAENRCTLFVKSGNWSIPQTPMKIAFEKNLVNQKFLECLEANGVLHEKFGLWKRNIAHVAAEHGRLDVIKFIAEKNASILAEFTDSGQTVANIAARKHRVDIVQCVLRAKPMSTVKKDWQEFNRLSTFSTVFHLAMVYGCMDMDLLKYLVVERRVPLTETDGDGEMVAHIAAKRGDMEKLQYLVEKDPSTLTIQDHDYLGSNTVLHTLATEGILNEQSLKFFVDKGAPLTVQNTEHDTVGHILAKNGHTDLVKYLVEKEPSILHILNRNGDTICHILARNYSLSVKNLRFFVEKGASLVAKSRAGDSIALIAAEKGKLRILEYVIEKEPSLFADNASLGVEVGNIAAERGHSNVLKFIAEKEPIFLAQRPGILFKLPNPFDVSDTLRYLKANCETKIPNWDRRPFENEALRWALEHDYPNVLKCMKYHVNVVNDQGEPLILTAIRSDRRHIFHYLATDGQANLTALDREGNNILFAAAKNGDLEKITYVLGTLKAPIDLGWRNKAGDSLLHVAVHEALEHAGGTHDSEDESSSEEQVDKLRVIKYLVEHMHADINARGHDHETVLQIAKARGNQVVSQYLLAHGADPKLCN